MTKALMAWAAAVLAAAPATAQAPAAPASPVYLGADLSFANEMADCGAVYRRDGKPIDPFALVRQSGGNLVRVRLWNNPGWTRYSTLADVEKTIGRAKRAGLQVLLDFHYSDDWADGDKQNPPAAWAKLSTPEQVQAVHDYTRQVLDTLAAKRLAPDLVQVGNETNPELMAGPKKAIDWRRNAALLNAGLRAVREAAAAERRPIRSMLHIAQPENAGPWFAAATAASVTDYDIIGLSYYEKWSDVPMSGLADTIRQLRARYGKDVMVVETAYPYTLDGADSSNNLLGADSLTPGFPATPKGQRDYMVTLTRTVLDAGGNGVVYWAPDWISTRCKTRWGTGSGWENATWFDLHHRWNALPVTEFMRLRR